MDTDLQKNTTGGGGGGDGWPRLKGPTGEDKSTRNAGKRDGNDPSPTPSHHVSGCRSSQNMFDSHLSTQEKKRPQSWACLPCLVTVNKLFAFHIKSECEECSLPGGGGEVLGAAAHPPAWLRSSAACMRTSVIGPPSHCVSLSICFYFPATRVRLTPGYLPSFFFVFLTPRN